MATLDDVREIALALPRTTEHLIRDHTKFRVGRLVYASVSPDEERSGTTGSGPGCRRWRPMSCASCPQLRSTTTGAWSDGPLPLRASRSTYALVTRLASELVTYTRSMRMPLSVWNMPAR